jgi:pyruvate kinase
VAFDDGKLAGVVEACQKGNVLVRVTRTQSKGFKMKSERGLIFPRADLRLDALTAKDLTDLDFIANHADLIGYSFVQSVDDITRLQDELARRRSDWQSLGIIAKIETARAVRNLPDIIVRAGGRQPFGVMIARGDLALAIGFERLAEIQEEILWLCEAAHVPVIWATQVLEEMVKSGLPTRGEMTDAAMAGRAECVMLNKGPNVGEAITALRGLLQRMMEHQSKKTPRLRALRSW